MAGTAPCTAAVATAVEIGMGAAVGKRLSERYEAVDLEPRSYAISAA